ncbi:MAG: glycoside hydrolase family 5 protein [Sedimentisphaerales bacterium]|nr:glycoside hydrolase family 5 protein [Sedimentisphaerales bacterium]
MRSHIAAALTVVGVVCACDRMAAANSEVPFHRGVNLTNWLQAGSVRQIQFTKYTKQDLVNIRSLGCDVIRLPINLHFMTDGEPAYAVDPLFYYFLDQIVDWCEELELHLILDNHTFDVTSSTDVNVDKVLVPVWSQMAERYKGRSSCLCYEILNEPHGIADARWGQIQQEVIDAIRAVDQTHTIVVTGAGWGSYNNLKYLPVYADQNLIYSFHFYDPFLFTHQGASWTNPSMVSLAGVPFPYNYRRMPTCPDELKGTWVQSSLNSYRTDGTVSRVRQLINVAIDFHNSRQVPVFCGEFGVYRENSDDAQRAYWYEIVRTYLEDNGIPWTSWDYQGGFGLFQAGTNELFKHDLNVPLVQALGLVAPEQTPFVVTPDLTGFNIYTDYVAPGVYDASWINDGTLDYYCDTQPAAGAYCIHCTGFDRYNAIALDFRPDRDLTQLVQKGCTLDLWVRGNSPGARFDVRFLDTKTTDPKDHPWRMRTTIDQANAAWDGQWHRVQIPLKSFTEHGSWDGAWLNPQGLFDWAAVDRFEIVSEHHAFTGMDFWFDDIRVANPPGSR